MGNVLETYRWSLQFMSWTFSSSSRRISLRGRVPMMVDPCIDSPPLWLLHCEHSAQHWGSQGQTLSFTGLLIQSTRRPLSLPQWMFSSGCQHAMPRPLNFVPWSVNTPLHTLPCLPIYSSGSLKTNQDIRHPHKCKWNMTSGTSILTQSGWSYGH